jgi:hypothetical protein
MVRRLFGLAAAVAVVVFAAACNETPPSAPQDGPSFGKAPSPNACLFTGNPSLSNSAGSYFQTSDDRKAASGFIAAMQDGYGVSGPAGARDAGYSLLALAGQASRDAGRAGPIDVGETMVKQAVNCMYDTKNPPDPTDFTNWPNDAQYDFSAALDAPHGGAFYVRGGSGDDASAPPVGNIASLNTLTDPAGGNVSVLAPPSGSDWPTVLGNKRTLVYGQPVTDGFDWKLIGRNTPFSPYAVVALCQGVHPGVDFLDADVVHQESVGTIGLKESEALCGTPPPVALSGWKHEGFALVGRLAVFADRLLSPEPLHAAVVVATRTIGGSASGAKSDKFTAQNLPAVNLKFTKQPPANTKVNAGRFGVTVNVTTPDGEPAGGITVRLSVTNNNGTGTQIFEVTPAGIAAGYTGCNPAALVPDPDHPGTQVAAVVPPEEATLGTVSQDGTAAATNAVWTSNLCITSPGAAIVVAQSVADGNASAGLGTKTSSKINVKP